MTFFDGNRNTGEQSHVTAIRERELDESVPQLLHLPEQNPHHGVALAAEGCHFISSVSNPDFDNRLTNSSLPRSFRIYDRNLAIKANFTNVCYGYHGSVTRFNQHLFGCASTNDTVAPDTGVLLIEYHNANDSFTWRKLPYPDNGARTGTIIANTGVEGFFGNYNAGGVNNAILRVRPGHPTEEVRAFVIDPSNTTQPLCDFALRRRAGSMLLVMHTNGHLHVLNSTTMAELAKIPISAPFACNTVGRPRMAVGIDHVYVSRPNATHSTVSEVLEIQLSSGPNQYQVTRTWNALGLQVHRMTVSGIYVPHNADDASETCLTSDFSAASSVATVGAVVALLLALATSVMATVLL
jgi:hypothetical protein